MPFAARLLLLMSVGVLSVQGNLMTAVLKGVMDGINLFKRIPDNLIHTDPCHPNPCTNGNCTESGRNFLCLCDMPHKGKTCTQTRNLCHGIECGHGDCVHQDKFPFYACKCYEPFRGPDCQSLSTSPCDPNPCQHGGFCVSSSNQAPVCTCSAGYKGRFCQIPPTDCYEAKGQTYRGVVSTTERGDDCLNWHSFYISLHQQRAFHTYHNSSILEENNHCRNPDGEDKPWCYVKRDGHLEWDYCNVKKCHRELLILTPPPKVSQDSPSFSQCGVSPPLTQPRIYGGSKAAPGAHPWLVSVQVRRKNSQADFSHHCGGSLIASCWVLTAAHCIENNFDYQVKLGGVKINQAEDKSQIIPVINAIIHKGYRRTRDALYSDVALLHLKFMDGDQCAKETEVVRTVCLPNQNFPTGKNCVVSGWGKTEDEPYSNHLLDVVVSLISQQRCRDPDVYANLLDSTMLCAGELHGGNDSCQGDSGGPLVCQHDSVHYLAGVVSWGHGCGRPYKPGVYANVHSFVNWIKQSINTPHTSFEHDWEIFV
ncbi:hyaluronan-binding protein 2-like isoform X2 [Nerophis ophidion]|uniref:hyaluronan-binding protein 2-like isoform X2 n=1 Tax=Nerophis ophidion TaxID=159077 RepID=UPI002ADF552C|nr:hyaluronan-binding protein 2-like isoform X2 [Nerophis ophidion]